MENLQRKEKIKNFVKSGLPLVYLVIALFALRWTIVEPYVVPTGSMEPTLKKGDRLYALKCAYDVRLPFTDITLFRTGQVKRGDVILFRAPKTPDITYVKRAIGLPGDRIKFTNGVLYVNGELVDKQLAPNASEVMYDIFKNDVKTLTIENLTGVRHYVILNNEIPHVRDTEEMIVPEGHYVAVGDNRDDSHDSRAWGFVPFQNMKGKGMFIWFSSENFKIRAERIGTLIQ